MNIIKVPAPPVRKFYIDVKPGSVLDMEFNPAGASFDRVNNDVVITLADGYSLFLLNFFITAVDNELPLITINKQPPIDAGTFLLSVNPYMNVMPVPASPPQESPLNSSGAGAYRDEAGELIAGLEGSADAPLMSAYGSGVPRGARDIPPTSGMPGESAQAAAPPPAPPAPVQGDYYARAVAYASGASTEARFRLLDAGGSPVPDSSGQLFSATSLNGYFDLTSLAVYPDGSISYVISGDGASALVAAGGGDIFEYIAFNFGGRTYTMQVVISATGTYSSAVAESDGWTPNSLYGEWHYGTGKNVNGAISGTAGNDEVWFYNVTALGGGTSFSGTLNLAGGGNKVAAHGGDYGISGASITSGNGADTINISSNDTAVRNSAINTGDGADVVKINGGYRGVESSSQSSVIAREGNVEITAAPASGQGIGVYASLAGSKVDIEAAEVSINVSGSNATGPLYGIYGVGAGTAVNVSSGSGAAAKLAVDVNQGSTSSAIGILAAVGSTVNLSNVEAQAGKALVSAYSSGGTTTALFAMSGDIKLEGSSSSAASATIRAESGNSGNGGDATALLASNGDVDIKNFTDLRIEAENSDGAALGLAAENGGTIGASNIDKLSINASTDSGLAYGVYAIDGEIGLTAPSGVNLQISAESAGAAANAYGVYSVNSAVKLENLEPQSEPLVEATAASGAAYGIYNLYGDMTISGDGSSGSTTIKTQGYGTAYAVYSAGATGSPNSLELSNFDHLLLKAESTGTSGFAAALFSSGTDATLEVSDVNTLELAAQTSGSNSAYGLYAGGLLQTGSTGKQIDDITITAANTSSSTSSASAAGIYATGASGQAEIVAGNLTITADCDNGRARGINNVNGGQTKIGTDGALVLDIDVSGPGNSGGSVNDSSYYKNHAIYSHGGNSRTEITGGAQADSIELDGGGVMASYGGANVISVGGGGDVLHLHSLTADGAQAPTGSLRVITYNSINAGSGDNTITVDEGGIKAQNLGYNEIIFSGGGHNSISGGDIGANPDTVSTSESSNHFYNADAASAFNIVLGTSLDPIEIIAGRNGSNLIDTAAASQNDSITVFGGFTVLNAGAGYGNAISTLGGDDSISIYGDLSAQNSGHNRIEAGDGNDTVTVYGNITSSGAAFNDIDGGSGYDVFQAGVLRVNGSYSLALSDLAGILDGFERISLDGGTGSSLDINGLLSGLNIDGRVNGADFSANTSGISFNNDMALFVNGDVGSDSVTLTGTDWNNASPGYVVYDGTRYDVYSDSANTTYLLIQHGLI